MTAPAEAAAPRVGAGERGARILHEPRLLALLLAGGVMATIVVFVIGFSGAFYTAESSDGGSAVSAGEVRLTVSNTGELLDGAALKPGSTRTGDVTVTNTEHKARVTLAVTGLTETPPGQSLAGVLNVTVKETAPSAVTRYSGKLKDLGTMQLGIFGGGEQRSYQITVAWPAFDDSLTYANIKISFTFDWRAESVQ